MLRYLRVCPCVFWHSSAVLEVELKPRSNIHRWWLWVNETSLIDSEFTLVPIFMVLVNSVVFCSSDSSTTTTTESFFSPLLRPARPTIHRRAYRKSSTVWLVSGNVLLSFCCKIISHCHHQYYGRQSSVAAAVQLPRPRPPPAMSSATDWQSRSVALFSRCPHRSVASAGPIDDYDATRRCWQPRRPRWVVTGDIVKGKKVQRIVKEDKADKERPGPDNNVAIVATTKSIVGQFSGFAARIIPQDLIEKRRRSICIFP